MDVRIASGRIDHAYANGLGVPFFPFRKNFAASRSIQRTTRSVFVQTFRESEFRSQELQEFRSRRMDVRIAGGHRSCVRQRFGVPLFPFRKNFAASVRFNALRFSIRSNLRESESRIQESGVAGVQESQNGRPNRGWAHRSCLRQRFGVPLFPFRKNFAASRSIQRTTRSEWTSESRVGASIMRTPTVRGAAFPILEEFCCFPLDSRRHAFSTRSNLPTGFFLLQLLHSEF